MTASTKSRKNGANRTSDSLISGQYSVCGTVVLMRVGVTTVMTPLGPWNTVIMLINAIIIR